MSRSCLRTAAILGRCLAVATLLCSMFALLGLDLCACLAPFETGLMLQEFRIEVCGPDCRPVPASWYESE